MFILLYSDSQPASHSVSGSLDKSTNGQWSVWITTGSQKDAGTKDDVFMVAYGTLGYTERKLINTAGELTPASITELKVCQTCKIISTSCYIWILILLRCTVHGMESACWPSGIWVSHTLWLRQSRVWFFTRYPLWWINQIKSNKKVVYYVELRISLSWASLGLLSG